MRKDLSATQEGCIPFQQCYDGADGGVRVRDCEEAFSCEIWIWVRGGTKNQFLKIELYLNSLYIHLLHNLI